MYQTWTTFNYWYEHQPYHICELETVHKGKKAAEGFSAQVYPAFHSEGFGFIASLGSSKAFDPFS